MIVLVHIILGAIIGMLLSIEGWVYIPTDLFGPDLVKSNKYWKSCKSCKRFNIKLTITLGIIGAILFPIGMTL